MWASLRCVFCFHNGNVFRVHETKPSKREKLAQLKRLTDGVQRVAPELLGLLVGVEVDEALLDELDEVEPKRRSEALQQLLTVCTRSCRSADGA